MCVCRCVFPLYMCMFIFGMWPCLYISCCLKWSEYVMCIHCNLNICEDMNLCIKVWIKKNISAGQYNNYSLFINNKLVCYFQHVSCLNSSLSSTGTIMVCCDMRVNSVYHIVSGSSWSREGQTGKSQETYTAESFHSIVHVHCLICTAIKESIHIFA